MPEIIFLQDDAVLIPPDLIRAARDFDGFSAVHRQYWTRYGGQEGLCTYQDAFEYLATDMREYGLPVRYSSYGSLSELRRRKK